jgi:trans-aconitate 2-methyltransferase
MGCPPLDGGQLLKSVFRRTALVVQADSDRSRRRRQASSSKGLLGARAALRPPGMTMDVIGARLVFVGAGAWDPVRYERFKDERTRPFFDLLALLAPVPRGKAVDLGCGTGELTRILHERLAAAETLGVDSSPEMLAHSRSFAGPGVRFELADAATFSAAEAYDVVFSNAALHWIPDHPALFRRLTAALRPGGQLAVQVPANHDHLSHWVARAVAEEMLPRTDVLPPSSVLKPESYATLLDDLGYREQVVRLEVYSHRLPARDDVVDWVCGTTLTPLRARLDDVAWQKFLTRYRQALLPQLSEARPYFYTFKRILICARRG